MDVGRGDGPPLFSPDSSRVISGSFDKTIRVWQVVPDQERRIARRIASLCSGADSGVIGTRSVLKDVTLRMKRIMFRDA
jgi:hypothetical protein